MSGFFLTSSIQLESIYIHSLSSIFGKSLQVDASIGQLFGQLMARVMIKIEVTISINKVCRLIPPHLAIGR